MIYAEIDTRLAALLAAEKEAEALFDAIEARGLIAVGRSERERRPGKRGRRRRV